MAKSSYQLARDLIDLEESQEQSDEPSLNWEELAELLGVKPNADGDLNSIEMANACLACQGNPRVQSLPTRERLRAIRSAAGALNHILYSR